MEVKNQIDKLTKVARGKSLNREAKVEIGNIKLTDQIKKMIPGKSREQIHSEAIQKLRKIGIMLQ